MEVRNWEIEGRFCTIGWSRGATSDQTSGLCVAHHETSKFEELGGKKAGWEAEADTFVFVIVKHEHRLH